MGFARVCAQTDCAFSFVTLQKLCVHNPVPHKGRQNPLHYEYRAMHVWLPNGLVLRLQPTATSEKPTGEQTGALEYHLYGNIQGRNLDKSLHCPTCIPSIYPL